MPKSDENTSISFLKKQVKEFINERDWEKYHNPKNIAESVSIEAAELLEEFQWKDIEESESIKNDSEKIGSVQEEVADVLIYCLSLAANLDLDLTDSVLDKLDSNREKYPVEDFKGKWHKTE